MLYVSSLKAQLSVGLLVAMAGCSSIKAFPDRGIPEAGVIKNDLLFVPDEVIVDYSGADAAKQRAVRDGFITRRIAVIDYRYANFLEELQVESTSTSLVADLAVMALGAVGGSLSAGETTARALSTSAGAVAGAQASYDKNVLFERTVSALISQMEASRAEIRTQIFSRMANSPESAYPLAIVQADLRDYYFAGTLHGAISAVTKSAGAQEQQAERDLSKAIHVQLTDSFRDLDTLLSGGAATGAYRTDRVKLLKGCASELNISDFDAVTRPDDPVIAIFLATPEREDDRRRLRDCILAKV